MDAWITFNSLCGGDLSPAAHLKSLGQGGWVGAKRPPSTTGSSLRSTPATLLRGLLATLFTFAILVSFVATPAQAAQWMRLKTRRGTLYGTLELPSSPGPWPVALIIAGSGPTDRDGNNPLGGTNNHLKLLAKALADQGIASLRYDKRGVGKSLAASPPESQLRFGTYVADAKSWGRVLERDSRFTGLYVVGHSEGSLIGMIAARDLKPAGFVSISGTSVRANKLIRGQLAKSLSPELLARSLPVLDKLEAGEQTNRVPPELSFMFRPSVQPYLVSWFQIDPIAEMREVPCPALVVQGTTDIQVPPEQAQALVGANPRATLCKVDGMNHIMKLVPADRPQQLASYDNPKLPLAEEVVDAVSGFIHKTEEKRGE